MDIHPPEITAPAYLNAVDGAVLEAGYFADGGLDFGGGDVLAVPAERVAQPVDEVEVAQLVHFEQVT